MKTLSLMIDTSTMVLQGEDAQSSPQKLSYNMIRNICMNWSMDEQAKRRGMSEEDRRLYYKLCDDIEEAVETGAETVELEDDRYGFLKKCCKAPSFPSALQRKVDENIWAAAETNHKKEK